MPEAMFAGLLRTRLKVAVIKPVAGAGIGAELLPQLAEFQSLRDPMPESIELRQKSRSARCGRRRRTGRGLKGRGRHHALSEQTL
jgi:hypothetical protein